jgi:hypothetical protein
MPSKKARQAGAAGADGGSREEGQPTLDAKGIPLDDVDNPPVIGRYVQLTPDAEKLPAYEHLQRTWMYPRICEIIGNGTVKVLWQTQPGHFQDLTIDLTCLCYTIAVPGVDINNDGTLAEIHRRTAAEQKANCAKTKSDQDSERAIEKARLDAAKAASKLEITNALTVARQAALAMQLEMQREDQLKVQKVINEKQKKEIEKLKAQLQAQKAQKAQPAPSTLQAATQADVDKLHATIADLNAQLTAATTGAARNNDQEVDALRAQLCEAKIQVKTFEKVISTFRRGLRQKLVAMQRADDDEESPDVSSSRPRKKNVLKLPPQPTGLRKKTVLKMCGADEYHEMEVVDDEEGPRYSGSPVRRRGGGAGRAAGERERERAKPYDRPDSARASVTQKPPKASNVMEMEMEEVSDNDTAGAPATPGKQLRNCQQTKHSLNCQRLVQQTSMAGAGVSIFFICLRTMTRSYTSS